MRDLWKKRQKPDSPRTEPSTIKEAIRVGGLTIEREFRGTEAVLQYRDGTSRLIINQLKPEAAVIFDAARLVSLGRFGEARAKVSEAIKLLEGAKLEQPLRLLAGSYLIQGDAAFGKGLYADAERFYSSSHQFASTVDDGLLIAAARGVGIAKGSQGRHEDALRAYDECLELDSKNANAWYNKGVALSDLSWDENALQTYDEVLKLNPKEADAWNNRARALSHLGRENEALASINKAMQFDPTLRGKKAEQVN